MNGPDPSPALASAMAGRADVEQRATPAAAFRRARELFRAGEHLDMAQLAGDLGVARGTLYRWTGDRSRLLEDISWVEVEALLRHIEAQSSGSGFDRLQRMAGMFLDAIAGNPSLRAFLAGEGEAGLRLLTSPAGRVRPRIIAAVTEIIEREVRAQHYRPPDDPHLLADGIVSLGERFLYHDGEQTMNPDPETAKRIIRLVLREDP